MTPDATPEQTLIMPVVAEDARTETMQTVPETEVLPPLPEFAGASLTGQPETATTGETALQEAPDGPCRCGTCGTVPEPGKDALLYYGPGIVTRMWEARIRNGQWADIPAEVNAAHARTHLPALKRHGE